MVKTTIFSEIKHHFNIYLLLFFLNAIEMILETSASRLLAPSHGTTNAIWIAIIGIILLSNSVGNYVGGKLSQKFKDNTVICVSLLIASITICVIPAGVDRIALLPDVLGVELSAILSSILLFFIPTFAISIANPVLMKQILENTDNVGFLSGIIHADIAIGSLFGVFLGGFVLLPNLGVETVLFVLASLLSLSSLLFVGNIKTLVAHVKQNIIQIVLFVLSFCILGISVASHWNTNQIQKILDVNYRKPISVDTEYTRIILQNMVNENGDLIRLYKSSGAYSSATYLNADKKYDLVFEYFQCVDKILPYENISNTLMIGGAAYMYPKYYISHFPDKSMDVVEIDEMSTELARKYFYLDDLIQEHHLQDSSRLGLYNEDGRIFLNNTRTKYDCIINDAFSGGIPVATLATVEAIKKIKKALSANGVYIINILGSLSGNNSRWVLSEYKTLQSVFPYVYFVQVESKDPKEYQNNIVLCSETALELPDNLFIEKNIDNYYVGNELLLTDSFCPVDELVGNGYFE